MSAANILNSPITGAPAITTPYASGGGAPPLGVYLPLAGGTMDVFPAGVINAHTIVGPAGGILLLDAGAGGDVNVQASGGNASLTGDSANVSAAVGVGINSTGGGPIGIDTTNIVVVGSILTPSDMLINTVNQTEIHNRCIVNPAGAALISYVNDDYGLRVADYDNDAGIQNGIIVQKIKSTASSSVGVTITDTLSLAGNAYGEIISTTTSTSGTGVGMFVVGVNGNAALGIQMANVTASAGTATGIEVANVQGTGGDSIGLNLGGIVGTGASSVYGVYLNSMIGTGTGAVNGMFITNITGESVVGERINTVTASGTSATGFELDGVIGVTNTVGIKAINIASSTAQADGLLVSGVTADSDANGIQVSGVSSVNADAYGLRVGGIQTLAVGGRAYGLYIGPIIGAGEYGVFQEGNGTANGKNVFKNKIECGAFENVLVAASSPSLNIIGTIKSSLQSSAVLSYTVLNNGGNTVISKAGNTTLLMPVTAFIGTEYTIWKNHGGAVTINGNGPNINGAPTFNFAGAAYGTVTIVWEGTEWFAHLN